MRAADDAGSEFFSAIASIGSDASLGGVRVAQTATTVLSRLPDDVLLAIKNSTFYEEAIIGLARSINAGVDPQLAHRILTNTFYSEVYTPAHILVDMGRVAHAEGFVSLAKRLKIDNPQALGNLYELQVAAHFATRGIVNICFISKFVRADATLGLTSTDIDLIIDGVYVQVKRSTQAFEYGQRGLDKAMIWVAKARNDGAEVIKYVTRRGVTIPPRIEQWLGRQGIRVVRVGSPME
ncbi:MAG: hypothetical protein ACYTHJ_09370 [Planctomycetota bacterium]